MGAEFVVGSLEEMCDLMCNNNTPTQEEYWIFTFGCGQLHAGRYVKIFGNYGEARTKMCEAYGDRWAFQYSAEEWESMKTDPERCWEMETELEVIK